MVPRGFGSLSSEPLFCGANGLIYKLVGKLIERRLEVPICGHFVSPPQPDTKVELLQTAYKLF